MNQEGDLLKRTNRCDFLGPVYFGSSNDITGQINFYNSSSNNATTFQAGNATAAVTYTLPTAGPAGNNYALVSSTAGVLSWLTNPGTFAFLESNQTFTGINTFSGQLIGKGTSTNDNAATGYIGEYLESLVTSQTTVGTNNQYFDLTSLTLTAGDWDVTGMVLFDVNSATFTTTFDIECGIGTVTGNSSAGLSTGVNYLYFILPAADVASSSAVPISIPVYRISISSTATYYLKGFVGNYTAGTPKYRCRLSARRTR